MAHMDGLPVPRPAPGQPCVSKLVLLGSGSVGKSSLVLRYSGNSCACWSHVLRNDGLPLFTLT
uniref:Uncharacterized protein n=1 Tax=Sciurus vulgaris TaxID=55149 RepID=A0A8D2DT02_SCIVU